ncbi:hypothetical protein E9934_03080 [Nocardioides caeni]|uniref:Uncharacterized protein n=1 Tax=Nocardioides caeni TaxID=574700 RepID=A0A4S8NNW3_9ACTN|nr:hypothetical protein E9934_03080 [Nocardioides caeni]
MAGHRRGPRDRLPGGRAPVCDRSAARCRPCGVRGDVGPRGPRHGASPHRRARPGSGRETATQG